MPKSLMSRALRRHLVQMDAPPANASEYILPGPKNSFTLSVAPTTPPFKEPVFCAFDVECNCHLVRPSDPTGLSFRAQDSFVSEVGLSSFDTRRAHNNGIVPEPGSLGHEWRRFINSHHFRIRENPHDEGRHAHYCGSTRHFAFGNTKAMNWLPVSERVRVFDNWHNQLCSLGLDPGSKEQRYLILVVWDETLERQLMEYLGQDGKDWFRYFDEVWDMQKHPLARQIARTANPLNTDPYPKLSLENALEYLGIWKDPFQRLDGRTYQLLHNAGNDTAFEMQVTIALLLATDEQREKLRTGKLAMANMAKPTASSLFANLVRPFPAT